jgi:hypothetical protein
MKQEEILDHVLDLPSEGGRRVQVEEEEIAACVQAAERVRALEGVEVPAEVALRVEQVLRARLRSSSLHQQQSRTSLERADSVLQPSRHAAHPRARLGRRVRLASFAIAAALVLAFTGLLAFAVHMHPSQTPSGALAPAAQGTRTPGRDSQARLQTELTLLQKALSDLQTAANDRRGDQALSQALQTVAARTSECRATAAEVPAGNQRTAAMKNLTQVLTQEEHMLRQLLPVLDWPLRLRFTRQLGVLGDAVPTVTHVTVQVQPTGTVLITLTGTHFAPQTRFILNGQPAGQVSFVTTQKLVVVLRNAQFSLRSHTFGVLNPDGTAAQPVSRDDDTAHGTGTPYPDN